MENCTRFLTTNFKNTGCSMIRIRTGNLGLCSAGFFFVATLATRHASCGWLSWFFVDLNPKLRLQYKDMCSRLLVSKNNIYEEKNITIFTLKWPQSSILMQQPAMK